MNYQLGIAKKDEGFAFFIVFPCTSAEEAKKLAEEIGPKIAEALEK